MDYLIQAVVQKIEGSAAVKASIKTSLLNRAGVSHGRPHSDNESYENLFIQVAHKYQDRVDEEGYFAPNYSDTVNFVSEGKVRSVRVTSLLNRSGLSYLSPATFRSPKYRFEPFWLHRYLAEQSPVTFPTSSPTATSTVTMGDSVSPKFWVGLGFTTVLVVFLISLFFLKENISEMRHAVLRFLTSLCAAFAAYFFIGEVLIQIGQKLPGGGDFLLTGTGGAAFFILVWRAWPSYKQVITEELVVHIAEGTTFQAAAKEIGNRVNKVVNFPDSSQAISHRLAKNLHSTLPPLRRHSYFSVILSEIVSHPMTSA